MDVLNYSRNAKVNRSTFNNVGGNQVTININNYSLFSLSGSSQTSHRLLRNDILLPTPGPEAPSQRLGDPNLSTTDVILVVETATDLIIQIFDMLIDHRNSLDNHRELRLELNLLQKTLTLTGLAIRAYDDRPLGHSLAVAITPEVVQCRIALLQLFDAANNTSRGLSYTSINSLWRQVFRSRWVDEELALLRGKLCRIQRLLGGLLLALNSYVLLVFRTSQSTDLLNSTLKYKVLHGWSLGTNSSQVIYL